MERLSTWSKSLTGSKPLFVFDLDSTITKCELLPLIAESVGLGSEMTELTEAAMQGNVSFEQSFLKRVGLLEQVSVSQARSIAAKQPLHEKIAGFIRANSQQCMILTGNLDVWIEPILEDLGMKESCVCSRAVVCNGHVQKISYIPDKGKVCKGLQRPFIATGDGSNDVGMLKSADIGIAFGGARALSDAVIQVADIVTTDENELISYLSSFL